jgi:hypothetical protein
MLGSIQVSSALLYTCSTAALTRHRTDPGSRRSLATQLQTQFWAVRDYLSPVLLHSKFKESGRLTPEEFVAAGDYLVYKFPTWAWEAGEEGRRRDYLPADKQYLVQRNGACLLSPSRGIGRSRAGGAQLTR